MEAMACKSAAVTWDTGGSQDYAFDGKTAFVAKHADFDDLVRKLKMAVSDKVLREQIAENGYKFIRSLSWDNAITRMEDIFYHAQG
jgi:glycosyltransferase involved in cell wall biosynthesis